ncbi:MAG: hypothetical protein IJK29_06385, partial [Bacteroidales bacterium]|nr:hypothetical protein [Bacteroidales bacterium]
MDFKRPLFSWRIGSFSAQQRRFSALELGYVSELPYIWAVCFIISVIVNMKRVVIFLLLGLGVVLFSCQKDNPDVLKPVDDVCSVMDDEGFKKYCLGSF